MIFSNEPNKVNVSSLLCEVNNTDLPLAKQRCAQKTSGPGSRANVTLTRITYLNIGSSLPQQDDVSCHTTKAIWDWFEQCNKDLGALT